MCQLFFEIDFLLVRNFLWKNIHYGWDGDEKLMILWFYWQDPTRFHFISLEFSFAKLQSLHSDFCNSLFRSRALYKHFWIMKPMIIKDSTQIIKRRFSITDALSQRLLFAPFAWFVYFQSPNKKAGYFTILNSSNTLYYPFHLLQCIDWNLMGNTNWKTHPLNQSH